MVTHDLSTPILPGTLRISVIADGNVYVTDLPSARLAGIIKAFSKSDDPDTGPAECKAAPADANDTYMLCVGALVLFLQMTDTDQSANRDRLRGIVGIGGCAILTVSTESDTGKWDFRLYEVPIRPASVRQSRMTQQERRRWR